MNPFSLSLENTEEEKKIHARCSREQNTLNACSLLDTGGGERWVLDTCTLTHTPIFFSCFPPNPATFTPTPSQKKRSGTKS